MLYKECWKDVGGSLCDVIRELFVSKSPTLSMRTALMIFSSKPKKALCLKPSSKRRISILNTDFKCYEGLLARRFRKISGKALSRHQYVAGKDRNIQHGIARVRDRMFKSENLSHTLNWVSSLSPNFICPLQHTWIKSNFMSLFSLFEMREIRDIFMKNGRKGVFLP